MSINIFTDLPPSGLSTTVTPVKAEGFSSLSPGFPANKPVGLTDSIIIPSNALRAYAHIYNHTNQTIWIEYGAPAVVGQGIKLLKNSFLQISGFELWKGDIHAITQGGATALYCTEMVW